MATSCKSNISTASFDLSDHATGYLETLRFHPTAKTSPLFQDRLRAPGSISHQDITAFKSAIYEELERRRLKAFDDSNGGFGLHEYTDQQLHTFYCLPKSKYSPLKQCGSAPGLIGEKDVTVLQSAIDAERHRRRVEALESVLSHLSDQTDSSQASAM